MAPVVYRMRPGGFELSYPCPPDAICVDIAASIVGGSLTPGGLVLHASGNDLVFRRIE